MTRAEGESGKVEKKGDDKGSKKVQKVKLWPAAAIQSGVWQPSARSRASLSLSGALGGQADCLMPLLRLRSATGRARHFATIQLQARRAAVVLPKPALAPAALTHSGTALPLIALASAQLKNADCCTALWHKSHVCLAHTGAQPASPPAAGRPQGRHPVLR